MEDREYKFPIATGFPLYPKNYDGQYRGTVTLREALANSLNVPAVKVLEYVTLADFYDFLEHRLPFKPLQPLDSYQYGIALGGLEMDPLALAHLLTLFPNNGELKPLTLYRDAPPILPPMEVRAEPRRIAEPAYVALVNKTLSDRLAGVEQFGLAGNLNLPQENYAVKTGTSRDFHDTWTVGWTPDFLVVVWLGNAENEPMRQVTSISGAGKIWHDTMEALLNSAYNRKTPFDFSHIALYRIGETDFYGLPAEKTDEHRNLLEEKALILNPHDGDTFIFERDMAIPLKARTPARWYVNGLLLAEGAEASFSPARAGIYTVRAAAPSREEALKISVVSK